MKRCLAVLTVLVAVVGCQSARKVPDYQQPSPLLKEEVDMLLRELPYRHGPELIATLKRLVYIGEPAIEALVRGLRDEHPKTRSNAAYVLGEIRDRRVIPDLRKALSDESSDVRYEVAASLLILGDWSGIPELIEALDDEDPYHRYKAIQVLSSNTHQDLGYDYKASEQERTAATERWRTWYAALDRTAVR